MRWIIVFILSFFSSNVVFSTPLDAQSTNFLPKAANQQLDQISLQLSVQNLNINHLNSAVNTLSTLTQSAEECVDDAKEKLNGIDAMIKQGHDSVNTNAKSADFVYLSNEQKKWVDKQAQCRLFMIRAKEAIGAYKTAIAQLQQEATLERDMPLWQLISQIICYSPETPFFDFSTIGIPPVLQSLWAWGILLFSALIASSYLIIRAFKSRFAHRYLRPENTHFNYITLVTCCLMIASLLYYVLALYNDLDSNNPLLAAINPLLQYFISVLFVLFVFKLKKTKSFFSWYKLNIPFFKTLILWFISLYQLKKVSAVIVHGLKVNPLIIQLNHSIYLLLIMAIEIYFIYRFCRVHQSIHFIKAHQRLIRRTGATLLIACAVIEVLGYYTLAFKLIYSGFFTFAIVFIMVLSVQGCNKLYQFLNSHVPTRSVVIHQFGYKKSQSFTEFLILKIVFQFVIIVVGTLVIGSHWEFAMDYTIDFSSQLLNGIQIGNFTLYPTRMLSGVFVFCILYLLFRFISTRISKQEQFEDEEEETQVAIASIFTYIGFGLALIAGLLVSGFDFTALAIVAGALSVGIGLGLQSIVNNFVSGLILLIEKPIKPGDRINIDGVEGCVKKISVRSTLVLTPSREDIIIPNSDLITRRVTNYTYSDRYLSIHCDIKVGHQNDIHLIKTLLLQVANENDEVIKNHRNKPSVLFSSFDDKTLVFQLWCLIKDAHNKAQIQSELNFAIHDLFKANQIAFE